MPAKSASGKTKSAVRPRVKLWLEFEGEHVFCSGLCQILEAVRKTGSIKEAATEVGKSYRFVWDKIKSAERKLGQTLVAAQVGGAGIRRSTLTPLADDLVGKFLALRKELHAVMDAGSWASPLMAMKTARSSSTSLRD
jgi:molybdate transport system regulatory protein